MTTRKEAGGGWGESRPGIQRSKGRNAKTRSKRIRCLFRIKKINRKELKKKGIQATERIQSYLSNII